VKLADGKELTCHTLIIAVGLAYRKLEVPGINELTGAGVYYGASLTEAFACQQQPIFIVGAGNSAGQAALYLAQFAESVTMLVRGDSLSSSMSQYLIERIYASSNIRVRLKTSVAAVQGNEHLESITIHDNQNDTEETCPAAALFIFIGAVPRTDWLEGVVKRDSRGFIFTGPQVLEDGKPAAGWEVDRAPFLLETSVPGIFAVGDARAGSVKRVASAVGEGSIAVQFVHQHLSKV
jgi:thioredoxin reductase (NADPH)